VQLLHAAPNTRAVFDDRNLIACGGLAPLAAFTQRLGLPRLLAGRLRPSGPAAANAAAKAGSLIAGMAAGADSIDGTGLFRHGAMDAVFGGVRAPSTLGTFLRNLTWGNVRQLDAVHRELTAAVARQAPLLPAGTPPPSSTSTPPASASTATPGRAQSTATPRSRASPCWSRA